MFAYGCLVIIYIIIALLTSWSIGLVGFLSTLGILQVVLLAHTGIDQDPLVLIKRKRCPICRRRPLSRRNDRLHCRFCGSNFLINDDKIESIKGTPDVSSNHP